MFCRLIRANTKLILLTFEIFWITVFVLARIENMTAGGVPGFVYVNF
jgi:hypothetical protein